MSKSKRKNPPRRSATEARVPEGVWSLSKRRVTQADVDQARQRTPVEQQASLVESFRHAVSATRARITRLEIDLHDERSRLSAAMMAHIEETNKFKDMTALNHQVP